MTRKPLIVLSNTRAFIFRMKNDNGRFDEPIRSGYLAAGWSDARELNNQTTWSDFKSVIRNSYPAEYAENERALGNAAGSLWRFIHDMKVGDYAIVPTSGGFLVGEVIGPIFFHELGFKTDSCWRRQVRWLNDLQNPTPRSHASNELQRRMKAYQTCVECTDLLDDLNRGLQRSKPLAVTDAIVDATHEAIGKCLRSAITDNGLEQVVCQLAKASGAQSATVQPKNSQAPGDVDVIAIYDLKIGNLESTIEVAYQVKQHDRDSITDEWGVQQLIERMNQNSAIVRGCLVTTAGKVSPKAQALAEDNNVIVITEKELVEWVLMIGLQALN